MGLMVKIICAVLLYNVNYFAMCQSQTDMITNISIALSSYFQINCFVIFKNFNETSKNFEIFKTLSSELKQSVSIYTFEDRWNRKSCHRPMNLIIGDELKDEFASFTKRNSMADEIWIVFLRSQTSEFFEMSRPSFDSEVVAAEILSSREVYFREVYAIDNGFPLKIQELGRWTRQSGLNLSEKALYDRRSDLDGKVFRVGSNENWPVCSFKNGLWDGLMPRLWKEIQALINCTTVPVGAVGNATGLILNNGSWTGLMGMLINDEIDMIAAELTINKARINVIKFSLPMASARYQLYFKAIGFNLQWKAILRPFSFSTWMALFAWTLIGSTCISVTYKFYLKNGSMEPSKKIHFITFESFFFVLQSLCQQGYPMVPKRCSGRILFVTAYALSTIMIPSYSASLISSLTHQTPARPFDSMEEMAAIGTYKLLVRPNSAALAQFSFATDSLYRHIYENHMDNVHVNAPYDNTVKILDDIVCDGNNYAYYGVDEIVSIKMEFKKPKCLILKLSEPLSLTSIALGMKKDSPFSNIINNKLQKLANNGVKSRIKASIRPLRTRRSTQLNFSGVEVKEVFQIFLLLLLGMIISVFVLIIEKMMWHFNRRTSKNIVRTQLNRDRHYKKFLDFYLD